MSLYPRQTIKYLRYFAVLASFIMSMITVGCMQPNSSDPTIDNHPLGLQRSAKPVIINQPQSQTVVRGNQAYFWVNAKGKGPMSFQWKKNGVNVFFQQDSIPGDSGHWSTYATPITTLAMNNSKYTVVVKNSAGSVTSTIAILTVINPPPPTAPVIIYQPQGDTVVAGTHAYFSVFAKGNGPMSFQWKKNGVNVFFERDSVPGDSSHWSTYETPITTLAMHNSQYTVVVSNSVGSATSTIAILTVINPPPPTAPVIIYQPQSQTVVRGNYAYFSVYATGTGPLRYQWKKNGVNVSNPGDTITGDTTNSSTYRTLTDLSMNNSQYTVVVSNSVGSATSAIAILTVTNPLPTGPIITRQPQNQSIARGQRGTFSVSASGVGRLRYQWQKNGVNITNAIDSSYTTPLTNPTTPDSTAYRVEVRDSVGSTMSNSALLLVH